MMAYAEKFLRGISTRNGIENEIITADAMQFDKADKTGRTDGYDELSITFFHNDESLNILKKQKKNETLLQFPHGFIKFSTSKYIECILNAFVKNELGIEERKVIGNSYHGNLLMVSNINNARRNQLRGIIGFCQTGFIENDECE